MTQSTIDFTSPSPINAGKLSGQNERLYNYLREGNKIHVFSPAKQALGIGYLNSRCSDLINVHHIPIHKERIQVSDSEGNLTTVVEYSLEQATIFEMNKRESA